ncbi:MAG: ATP-binding protein [Nitrospirota bacterium]|nr:ATP-binding protein [Nitrospirota bacterium]
MAKAKSAGGRETPHPGGGRGADVRRKSATPPAVRDAPPSAPATDISQDILASLETFEEIGESLRGTSEVAEICDRVVQVLKARMGLETCSIMLVNGDGRLVNVAGTSPRGKGAAPTVHRSFRLGEGIAGSVAESGEAILLPDVTEDPRFTTGRTAPTVRSLLCLPIKGKGEGAHGSIGVLNLSHGEPGFFSHHHRTVFGILATLLGRLLTEARLAQELTRFNRELEEQVAERTREIQASHAYLEQLLEQATDVILTVDWRGRVTYANPCVRVLGYARENLMGQPFSVLCPAGTLPVPLKDALAGVVGQHVEIVLQAKDGAQLDTWCSFSPLESPDAGGRGALVMIRDVTRGKRLELQVRQMEKLTAIGTLVAGIAHEINNKLVPILVYSELLQRAELGEREMKLVKTVHKSAVNARHIMDSLLRFSRQEAPRKELCSLNEVVQDVINMVQFRTRKQDVTLTCEPGEGIPPLSMDAHQIAQVVLNIVNNACDAVEGMSGTVSVTTRMAGGEARILIADNGPGIDPKVQARIFDPFFTTKEVGKGTGLGLSLCYGIVQEHGGGIRVESRPGATRFEVTLPVESGQEVVRAPRRAPAIAARRGRCLVADGDPTLREVLEHVLAGHHEVVPETTGNGVIARLAEGNFFDVLLLDLNLSERPGEEVLAWIHQHRPELMARVVLMTSGVDDLERLRQRNLKAGCVVTKPFQMEEVQQAVAGMLASGEPGAGTPEVAGPI